MGKCEWFVFGILAYNSKDTINETLKSIEYQINRYRAATNYAIVITDDCSVDNTVEIVEQWLSKNESMFSEIKFIKNEKNCGVVYNFNKILDDIPIGTPFKVLAADDVFSSGNLVDKVKSIKDKELHTYLRVFLKNGKLFYQDYDLRQYYIYLNQGEISKEKKLRYMRRGNFLHTPSTIFTKKLYQESGCHNLNKKFRLYEDDPTWYSMIRNNNDLSIKFKNECIVLYRLSEKSISQDQVYGSPFIEEQDRLMNIYEQDCHGMEKLYIKDRKKHFRPKYLRISRYEAWLRIRRNKILLRKDKGFKKFKQHMDKIIEREQAYYNKYIIEDVFCDMRE